MKQSLIAALGVLFFSTVAQAATYEFDPSYTEVRFYYDAQGLTIQSGEWANVTGSAEFDGEDLSTIKVSVSVAADSVDTGVTALDDHLKSDDFFDVEKHPTITFESTGVRRSGLSSVVVTGDLTIKGITKPVDLDVTMNHIGPHPLGSFFDKYQGEWIGITADGSLLRSEFDLGLGAPITGDRIRLEIFVQMKADEA
ncbi:MAG: polyisoprenoid-binding protein [Alphaproteobacteria bacterium]|nr:polyisoprenoid-binding protein [Alphaproteobacteria bacterium]